MRYALFALVLAAAPGCDVDGCETFAWDGPALVVFVRDAETEAPLGAGVSVVAQADAYSERLTLVESQPPVFEGLSLAHGRPPVDAGSYTVTVSAGGYEPATAVAEVVADDVCFSTPRPSGPAELTIELTPSAP
ncbi:hypothetical protein [Rubrivirga sp.]|uniref:hypothetical protein n=1 Tax=Rubrivirga sp. TaxID=1885344 RepID=UPI003B527A9A